MDLTGFDLSNLSEYREHNQLEAKKAKGGFPASFWETYSAFANTDSVDRTILTLSTGGNGQDIKAMLELYGDMIEDHEPQIDQETTQRGNNTTQTTTQTTTRSGKKTTRRGNNTTQTTTQTLQETTQTNNPKLQPVQVQIIQELKKNPNLSRKDLAKIITSVTEDGIKYHLKKLQEKGLLRRVGADYGGHWEIVK